MPTELLPVGVPTAIIQNQIYALPASRVQMFAETASTFEQSNHVSFANPIAIVLIDGQAELAGGFFRCTNANTLVTFKKV